MQLLAWVASAGGATEQHRLEVRAECIGDVTLVCDLHDGQPHAHYVTKACALALAQRSNQM